MLPEYCISSWAPEAPHFKPVVHDASNFLSRFRALAAELGVGVVPGTLLEATSDGGIANICYFIGPGGDVLARYQKKNLWHPERQHLTADAHTPHAAFDTPWGRVGLIICWDLAFPEACRALLADDARIIICPSFWVAADAGEGADINPDCETLFLENTCVARAYENTCAFVFVNTGAPPGRTADDAGQEFVGLTQVAMPLQGALGKLGAGEDMSLVDVDMGVLDVAESVYKVRADVKGERWHYAYALPDGAPKRS